MEKSDVIVKIKPKIYPILASIFALITIISIILQIFNSSNNIGNIAMLSLGLMILCSGLTQISRGKQVDSNGVSRGSKPIGIFSIIVGIVNIMTFFIKMIK